MKHFGAAFLCVLLAFTAGAQTNPSLVATNLVPNGRQMSMQDCIQAALRQNLDVQIQRYNPEIDLYNLQASYGAAYDPTLSASGSHDFNVQPGGFFDGIQLPSETTKEDQFSSGIKGELPVTGLQYDLSGNINQQHFLQLTNDLPDDTRNSGGSVGITLTQPLLKNAWIDQNRLTILINKNTLLYDEQGFREQVITSVTAVANAYYELIYALENLKVQQEALDLSQTQLDQDKQRLQIGTLAQLSVQQDESQVAQNEANVITAQSTLETDQNTLKNLITDNYSELHNADIQPKETLTAPLVLFDLQDSWSRGMTERPDLIQYRLNVKRAGIQLKFDHNQLFPELDVIGTYGWNGDGQVYNGTIGQINQGNAPYYSIGGQFSMPLANLGARNQVKSDKVTLKQVVLKLKQYEQTVMVGIDNAVKTAQSDYESVDATRQARIYAEAALDAEQKTYAVGKATTFEVLTYQNSLTGARGQEIRALANYEEALANLYSQEGSTLDRLGINIEATP
ncbi:MAG TPA: TolC family protein [Verrucomicrobiae bacterium]